MHLLTQPHISAHFTCPYLAGATARFAQFHAAEVTPDELDALLRSGWRAFGTYFFRVACPQCRACIPLRIEVSSFLPSKSQRRTLRKNADVDFRVVPLCYSDDVFDIYRDHSLNRFGKEVTRDGFLAGFYTESCPSFQSELRIDGALAGLGFLHQSVEALSSAYFIFRSAQSERGLGTLSILREIEYAARAGLRYYYLGYWVEECRSLAYKSRFGPHQRLDWALGEWLDEHDNPPDTAPHTENPPQ